MADNPRYNKNIEENKNELFNQLMQQAQGSYNYNPYASQEYSVGMATGRYPFSKEAISQSSPATMKAMQKMMFDIGAATLPMGAGGEALAAHLLERQLAKWAARPGVIAAGKEIDPITQLINRISALKSGKGGFGGLPPAAPSSIRPSRGPSPIAGIARDIPSQNTPGTAGYGMEQEIKNLSPQELVKRIREAEELIKKLFGGG